MALNDYPTGNNSGVDFNALTKPRKIALVVLVVLAVAIIIFWIWQIRSQINGPFSLTDTNSGDNSSLNSATADILKGMDTDSDGLSDYDEIYIYGTSPYLEDTDGDGISDYDEVMRGTDPLCLEGKNCYTDSEIETTDAPNILPPLLDMDNNDLGVYTGVDEQTALQALSGNIDAQALRDLLLSTGVTTVDILDQISDEDLLKSYRESLQNQNQ